MKKITQSTVIYLSFVYSPFLIWLPFVLTCTRDVMHTCPSCGYCLGRYSRFRHAASCCDCNKHIWDLMVKVFLSNSQSRHNRLDFNFCLMPRVDTIDLVLISVQCPGPTQSTSLLFLSNAQGRHNRPDFCFCQMLRADTIDLIFVFVQCQGPTQSIWFLL